MKYVKKLFKISVSISLDFLNKPNVDVEISGHVFPGHDSLSVSCAARESNEYLTLVRVPADPQVCEQSDHSVHTKAMKYINNF